MRSQGSSSALCLAETVAARGLAPSAAGPGAGGDPSDGALCWLAGARLVVPSGQQELSLELPLAELGAVEVRGAEGLWAVAVVPARPGQGEDVAAADERVVGWVLLCLAEEREEVVTLLASAGCVRGDLADACKLQEDVLGAGGFSTVRRARWHRGPIVAVKQVAKGISRSMVQSEVEFLVSVQPHPNVIGFHGVFTSSAPGMGLAIVLDCAAGGDLVSHCSASGCFAEAGAASVMGGVFSALAHIHASGIVHRDVKPENVLLMADGRAVLADFGGASWLSDGKQLATRVGSLGYAAPEVLQGRKYGCPIDCFGAGGVLYFALVGSPPFESRTREAVMWKTCDCRVDLSKKPWTTISTECKELLQRLLCRSSKERITAVEASQHSWLLSQRDACGKQCWEAGSCTLRTILTTLWRTLPEVL